MLRSDSPSLFNSLAKIARQPVVLITLAKVKAALAVAGGSSTKTQMPQHEGSDVNQV